MRMLLFLHLMRITSCFAAFAARRGFTLLILWASNTTRFSSRWSKFCSFTPRIHQKRSHKVRNQKREYAPRPPPSRRPTSAQVNHIYTGTSLFKILDQPRPPRKIFDFRPYEIVSGAVLGETARVERPTVKSSHCVCL